MAKAIDVPPFRTGQVDLSVRALNGILEGAQLAERARVVPVQPTRPRQIVIVTKAAIDAGALGNVRITGYDASTGGFEDYGDEFEALNLGPANVPVGVRLPLTLGEGQVQSFNYFTSAIDASSSSSSSSASSTSDDSLSSASEASSSSSSSSSVSSSSSGGSTPTAQTAAFRVYLSSAATIPTGVWTSPAFTGEDHDRGNNVAAGVFTAPEAGVYHFECHVYWVNESANTGTFVIDIAPGGTEQSDDSIESIWAGNDSIRTSVAVGEMLLTLGETVSVRVYQSTGGNVDIDATRYLTFFSGHGPMRD